MARFQVGSQSCQRLHRYMKYVDVFADEFHQREVLLTYGDPMSDLDDETFVERYQLPKYAVHELCNVVCNKLKTDSGTLSVEIQVLVALRFYVTGSMQIVLSDENLSGLGESVANRCVAAVTEALQDWSREQLRFPCTRERLDAVKKQFQDLGGFPNVLGVIRCMDVAITCPKSEASYVYLNRNEFYSINAQLVCDPDMYITNVFAKFPGSCDDHFIWSNSKLREELMTGSLQDCGWLVTGSETYETEPWLMTPIKKPLNEHERAFNVSLQETTFSMTKCVALLRARFASLDPAGAPLQYDPLRCCKLTLVVCALHNLCLALNLPHPPIQLSTVPDSNGKTPADDASGNCDIEDCTTETEGNIAREIVITTYF